MVFDTVLVQCGSETGMRVLWFLTDTLAWQWGSSCVFHVGSISLLTNSPTLKPAPTGVLTLQDVTCPVSCCAAGSDPRAGHALQWAPHQALGASFRAVMDQLLEQDHAQECL